MEPVVPTAYGWSQFQYLEQGHPMQFTTGPYSWAVNRHAEQLSLVAVGLSWLAGTKQREARQQIQQALQQAGLQVIKAIFVLKLPGTKVTAGDTAIVSFNSRDEAVAVRSGSTPVLLHVHTCSGREGQLGLPVWLIHPGDPAMPASDSSAAAVHVSSAGLEGLNATQANMYMLSAWQSVYTTAATAAQQQARAISEQELQQIQNLQFFPGNTLKVADDTFRVTFCSPIAAASLIKLGSCRLSSGAVISFSSPNSVQLRGHQVMLLAKNVGLLLGGVRGVAPYVLSGQRVPTVAEIQQIRQQLETSLGGRLPEPAVQLVPLKRTAAGQAAHLLVQVPSAAVAKQLVEQGMALRNGLYLRFVKHKFEE